MVFWTRIAKLLLTWDIAVFAPFYAQITKRSSILKFTYSKNKLLLCPLFLILFSTSCDLINPAEELPSYLQIDQFELSTTSVQGTDSEQITDIWIFVNDNSLGIYELPAIVPVLESGSQSVVVFPVIRENGIRSTPIIYPFYKRYETTVDFIADQTIRMEPTTSFVGETVFELVEDFNKSDHTLNGGDPNAVKIVNDMGQILLGEKSEVVFTTSQTFLDLPNTGGLAVFLEIDYKTNVDFEIGLLGIDDNPTNPINATNYKVILSPINRWNKVYISFQEEIAASQLPGYKLAFRASTENSILTSDPPEVLIDNIKFIRLTN